MTISNRTDRPAGLSDSTLGAHESEGPTLTSANRGASPLRLRSGGNAAPTSNEAANSIDSVAPLARNASLVTRLRELRRGSHAIERHDRDCPARLKLGLELEMASADPRIVSMGGADVPDVVLQQMLNAVARAVNPGTTPTINIKRVPGGKEAVWTDSEGRPWIVTPEFVDGRRKNGLELVTPPLHEGDEPMLARVRRSLQSDFVPGVRSGTHITFEIEHLVTPEGDASKLVDFILYVENHWPEIYAAVCPMRYGTIVNRFAVPLAVNQRKLLRELAALPQNSRHIDKVRAIFRKHEDRELQLNELDGAAYKFRAANWNKALNGIGSGKPRLVEFRIGDLLEAEEYPDFVRFFSALVRHGPTLEPGAGFADPFGGKGKELRTSQNTEKANRQLEPFNQRVLKVSAETYDSFLDDLRLPASAYRKLDKLGATDTGRLSTEAVNALLARTNLAEPVRVTDGVMTWGWEAEFEPQPHTTDIASATSANVEAFPYLDAKVTHEKTGTREVRSKPTDTPAQALAQMGSVKGILGEALTSFHLTTMFPKAAIDAIGKENFEAWISRLGDTTLAWRLQNRRHYYALNAWTHRRVAPDAHNERGVIRYRYLDDGRCLIELRGFMNDLEQVQRVAHHIAAGLQNPQLVRGFEVEQGMTFKQHPSFPLEACLEDFKGTPLSAAEKKRLKIMMDASLRNPQFKKSLDQVGHVLPLQDFDALPFLTPLERIRLRDAQWLFFQDMLELLQREAAEPEALVRNMTARIKTWAVRVDLHRILDESVLLAPNGNTTPTPHTLSKAIATLESNAALNDYIARLAKGELGLLLRRLDNEDIEALVARTTMAPADIRRVLEVEVARRGSSRVTEKPPVDPLYASVQQELARLPSTEVAGLQEALRARQALKPEQGRAILGLLRAAVLPMSDKRATIEALLQLEAPTVEQVLSTFIDKKPVKEASDASTFAQAKATLEITLEAVGAASPLADVLRRAIELMLQHKASWTPTKYLVADSAFQAATHTLTRWSQHTGAEPWRTLSALAGGWNVAASQWFGASFDEMAKDAGTGLRDLIARIPANDETRAYLTALRSQAPSTEEQAHLCFTALREAQARLNVAYRDTTQRLTEPQRYVRALLSDLKAAPSDQLERFIMRNPRLTVGAARALVNVLFIHAWPDSALQELADELLGTQDLSDQQLLDLVFEHTERMMAADTELSLDDRKQRYNRTMVEVLQAVRGVLRTDSSARELIDAGIATYASMSGQSWEYRHVFLWTVFFAAQDSVKQQAKGQRAAALALLGAYSREYSAERDQAVVPKLISTALELVDATEKACCRSGCTTCSDPLQRLDKVIRQIR